MLVVGSDGEERAAIRKIGWRVGLTSISNGVRPVRSCAAVPVLLPCRCCVGMACRLSLQTVRCCFARALPLRICRDGRIFCLCGSFSPSWVCLLVRYAFRTFCGVFGSLWRVLRSFARLTSLSNAPQVAKICACCVFCPRCVFSAGREPLPRL